MTTTTSSTSTTTTVDSAAIGSSLISALGYGGGLNLDTTSLASSLATAEYAGQNAALTNQLSKVQLQISEASQLKSDLLSFSSSLKSLVEGTNLLPQPSVTNSTVASASLPSGSAGASSSYTLEVTKLAASQVLASDNSSAGTAFKGGTLTFAFGSIASNGSFTQNSGTSASKSITIADGASLSQIATAINGANMGVTAYVANNANGQQVIIKGSEGATNAFTITSADDSGATATNASLSALAYDPTSSANTTTRVTASSDAAYKLDGISRTASSNTIDYAAPGLALKLTGTNSGSPTTITYSDPTSNIKSTMSNLVTALNSLVTEVNTNLSASTGHLAGDSSARAVKTMLSQLTSATIMPNAAEGEPKTLADLGVTLAKDGSLTLDSSKLNATLTSNTAAVASMFTNGLYGIYATVFNRVTDLTSSSNAGSLTNSVNNYAALQTRLTDKQTAIADLQSNLRARLINQFAAANSVVSSFNSTQSYLTNQIAQWNK